MFVMVVGSKLITRTDTNLRPALSTTALLLVLTSELFDHVPIDRMANVEIARRTIEKFNHSKNEDDTQPEALIEPKLTTAAAPEFKPGKIS